MLPSRSTFGQFPAGDFMFLTIKQLVFIIALCSTSFGQLWSGVLDPSRAIDWTHVGAAIPTTGSTLGWTWRVGPPDILQQRPRSLSTPSRRAGSGTCRLGV